MILFVGQVGSDVVEREGFQEIDYRRMYGDIAKWVAQIDRADRIHEMVSRAFHVAVSGRPGPVVLALPEDMLTTRLAPMHSEPYRRVAPCPAGRRPVSTWAAAPTSPRARCTARSVWSWPQCRSPACRLRLYLPMRPAARHPQVRMRW